MEWYRNLKISSKIMIVIGTLLFFLGTIGFSGHYFNSKATKALDAIYEQNLLPIAYLNSITTNIKAIDADVYELFLTNDKALENQLRRDIDEKVADNNRLLAEYEKTDLEPFEQEKLVEVKGVLQGFRNERKKALDLALEGRKAEAYNYYASYSAPLGQKFNACMKELSNYNIQIAKENKAKNDVQSKLSAILTVTIPLVAAVFGLAMGIYIARMIGRRLNTVLDVARRISQGDLGQPDINILANDEIGNIGVAINEMLHNLRNLVRQIAQSSEQVAASSEELTATAEQSAQAINQVATSINDVAQGAENQVRAVGEAAAVVEQMSAGIQQVAANANNMAAISDKTAHAAQDGGKAVETAVSQMASIEKSVVNSAQVVGKLGEQSKEIGQIVDTISGIAGQTNLLALNAAIEAARAGEQGRGFAVVAEEVRKLAEQSQEAAKQIADLISEIQSDTNKAVMAMNEGTREVKVGTEVVNTAGQAFGEIITLINQVSEQVKNISAAIQQMASGSQQIVLSVRQVDKISQGVAGQTQNISAATEEQSASMQEIASSSEGLSKMAQELQNAVSKFRV